MGESVEKPLDYYENNLGSTFSLVRAMQKYDVDKLVFSSSATVYGTDQAGATEDRLTSATNPYGWTKVMQEQILSDVAAAVTRDARRARCATSTRSARTRPAPSARTRRASPTT